MKKALVLGITGQDGSYLSEFLLSKNYEVHGVIRRSSSFNTKRIDHIFNKLHLHFGDVTDAGSITNIIYTIMPDEIYVLSAQSHVAVSFKIPVYTTNTIVDGTLNVLEAVRSLKNKKTIKIYISSSSEMFGGSLPPQNELTVFNPKSPYGAAKLASYWNGVNYREGYDMFVCNGILFNHCSPRRGPTFVSRKITKALAKIVTGKQNNIELGNINALRDWGFAPDHIQAMYKMMQLDYPDDFVIGTDESHSVAEFLHNCFSYVGLNYMSFLKLNEIYTRPTEVNHLHSDATKAREILGWEPSIRFDNLCRIMVDYDLVQEDSSFCISENTKQILNNYYTWSTIGEF